MVAGLAVAGSAVLLWLALDLKSDLVITEALPNSLRGELLAADDPGMADKTVNWG